jgi:cyclopropane fatty-acyl-phospholipid synthase-like methyltransferase
MRDLHPYLTTVTVDANQLVKEKSPYIDANHFTARTDQKLDFRDENNEKVIFDLVVSLEHFEHVSAESFNLLMENVVDHTKEGSHFVFTAAAWEYEEKDQKHVHCHIKGEYEWIKYVESYGFELIPSPFTIQRAGDTAEIFMKRVK